MSHINDSQSESIPKSLVAYQRTGCQIVYFISLVVSIPWKATSVYCGNFPSICWLCFDLFNISTDEKFLIEHDCLKRLLFKEFKKFFVLFKS